jgi:hypothetical protein
MERLREYQHTDTVQVQPCTYCVKKNRAALCEFTSARERGHVVSAGNTPHNLTERVRPGSGQQSRAHSEGNVHQPRRHETPPPRRRDSIPDPGTSLSPTISRDDHANDTVVPLEGRILRDAQGKVIFIGDCAPLSFLQTVRYLISSEVDSEGFAIQSSRDSMIEVARPEPQPGQRHSLFIDPSEIQLLVEEYRAATSGLVDLFDDEDLLKEMITWASTTISLDDPAAAVFFLVLAIGTQESDEDQAEAWHNHARDVLLKHMCNSMNVATVQGFTLVAIFMLRAFQPNGAYLYFCKSIFYVRVRNIWYGLHSSARMVLSQALQFLDHSY